MAKLEIGKDQIAATPTDADISFNTDLSAVVKVTSNRTPAPALVDSEAFKISTEKIRKQLNVPEAQPLSSQQLFVTKLLDDLKSGQQQLGDMSPAARQNDEASICIFVRGEKEVSVSTSKTQAELYVAGAISTLAWANFEAFARGAWHMLAVALNIESGEIGFSHGVLISDNKFCLAAKFKLDPRHTDALCSAPTQDRISTCISLLGYLQLWDDAAVKKAYAKPQDADLIEAARVARQEISTRELPFNCLFECDVWPQSFQIPKVLAARRPPTPRSNLRVAIGKSTGYCTDRRLFHFKITNTNTNNNSLENISFDEQEFFDEILAVSGKMTPWIKVSWTEHFQDKVIIARTLTLIERAGEALV